MGDKKCKLKCKDGKFIGGMMNRYVITCCSTADLSEEHFKSIEVPFASFTFEMDGKQYVDDLGKSIPFDEVKNFLFKVFLNYWCTINC